VVAEAHPAAKPNSRVTPPPVAFPAVSIPVTSEGWKVTPDPVQPAAGLASAVVLPDGRPVAVLLADPAAARAAVVLQVKSDTKPKENAPSGVLKTTVVAEWLQIDLKAGSITSRVPLGTHEFVSQRDTPVSMFDNAALSPSGDRLAATVPRGNGLALAVWDTSGKVIREWTDQPLFAGQWLTFATDDSLLARGAATLSGLDVLTGQVRFAATDSPAAPFALSPGRRWLAAAGPAGDLIVLDTSTGATAGRRVRPLGSGRPIASLAFTPDGTAVTASEHATRLQWLSPGYAMVQDTLVDVQTPLALWTYQPPKAGRAKTPAVVAPSSPDGRVWYAGAFNDPFARPTDPKKFTPGPLADAVREGKWLLAAFSVPHAAVRTRLDRAAKGIVFRRGEPIRVEVTGPGAVDEKKAAAEGAAQTLSDRGVGVDPNARAGIRIKLTGPRAVTVVSKDAYAPPGFQINKNSARGGYAVKYAITFFNLDGVVTPEVTTGELSGFAEGKDRLDGFYRYVGGRAADLGVPLEGPWDGQGPIELNGTSGLGIDGVLEP
jgi:hypothetical protein